MNILWERNNHAAASYHDYEPPTTPTQTRKYIYTNRSHLCISTATAIMSIDNVGSSLGMGSTSDPKNVLMNQVRQEAALNNARQLIEVCTPLPYSISPRIPGLHTDNPPPPETQRALLREVRPEARQRPQQRRAAVLHAVHGEVHVHLEHRQQAVHHPDTAGERAQFRGYVLRRPRERIGIGREGIVYYEATCKIEGRGVVERDG